MKPTSGLSPHQFPASVNGIGVIGCVAIPLLSVTTGVGRSIDFLVASGLVLFALAIASNRPKSLPHVVIVLYCINRLIRRLLDYSAGEFSQIPPTSLVVPAIAILMGLAAASNWQTLPQSLRKGASYYIAAVLYGSVIGARSGPGMVMDAIGWIAPFGFGLYFAWLRPTVNDISQYTKTFIISAVAAMAYGWIQWLILPEWDEFWIRNCGMGSIGRPYPMRCRFFGPLADPGAAGLTAATATALAIIVPCMSTALRGPLVVFLSISALMTSVRSSWLTAVTMVLSWIFLRRSAGGQSSFIFLAVVMLLVTIILPRLPGSDRILDRMETLSSVTEDGSFQARTEFSAWAIGAVLSHPLGHGLGSTGLAGSRLGNSTLVAFDSGYLQPLFVLGIPGSLLLVLGLYHLVRPVFRSKQLWDRNSQAVQDIAKAFVLGGMLQMAARNVLCSDYALFFWMYVLPVHELLQQSPKYQRGRTLRSRLIFAPGNLPPGPGAENLGPPYLVSGNSP